MAECTGGGLGEPGVRMSSMPESFNLRNVDSSADGGGSCATAWLSRRSPVVPTRAESGKSARGRSANSPPGPWRCAGSRD